MSKKLATRTVADPLTVAKTMTANRTRQGALDQAIKYRDGNDQLKLPKDFWVAVVEHLKHTNFD